MARLLRDGEVIEEVPLGYAGEQSTFAGELSAPAAGAYQLQVLAMDAPNANFGLVTQPLTVE